MKITLSDFLRWVVYALLIVLVFLTFVSSMRTIIQTYYQRGYKDGQLDFQNGEIRYQVWEDGYIEYKRID